MGPCSSSTSCKPGPAASAETLAGRHSRARSGTAMMCKLRVPQPTNRAWQPAHSQSSCCATHRPCRAREQGAQPRRPLRMLAAPKMARLSPTPPAAQRACCLPPQQRAQHCCLQPPPQAERLVLPPAAERAWLPQPQPQPARRPPHQRKATHMPPLPAARRALHQHAAKRRHGSRCTGLQGYRMPHTIPPCCPAADAYQGAGVMHKDSSPPGAGRRARAHGTAGQHLLLR